MHLRIALSEATRLASAGAHFRPEYPPSTVKSSGCARKDRKDLSGAGAAGAPPVVQAPYSGGNPLRRWVLRLVVANQSVPQHQPSLPALGSIIAEVLITPSECRPGSVLRPAEIRQRMGVRRPRAGKKTFQRLRRHIRDARRLPARLLVAVEQKRTYALGEIRLGGASQ